ncbi:MAG: hypothetical protein FD170_3408 [Bacteroidetes bacterium]|nr:MAG: hypothetical protein FD170_3408 [Bacteroidota bacterium]
MKKTFLLLFTLAAGHCNAATGDARDGMLAALAAIGLLLLLFGLFSLPGFLRKQIKAAREAKLKPHTDIPENKDLLLPEIDIAAI